MKAEEKVAEALFEKGWEWPGWLKVKNSRTVTIIVGDWQGSGEYEVTIEDVVQYFAYQAGSLLAARGNWA